MIKISQLLNLNSDEIKSLGHNGYSSDKIYDFEKSKSENKFAFSFYIKDLEKHYKKTWNIIVEDIEYYKKILTENNSFGVYEDGKLAGFILCEERKWNNTLYIENILVAEKQRGKGFGGLLIEKIKEHSGNKNFRLIELETQNTNVPAIEFYKKSKFEITGMNLKLYDPKINNQEIAIYMTCDLQK